MKWQMSNSRFDNSFGRDIPHSGIGWTEIDSEKTRLNSMKRLNVTWSYNGSRRFGADGSTLGILTIIPSIVPSHIFNHKRGKDIWITSTIIARPFYVYCLSRAGESFIELHFPGSCQFFLLRTGRMVTFWSIYVIHSAILPRLLLRGDRFQLNSSRTTSVVPIISCWCPCDQSGNCDATMVLFDNDVWS